MAVLQRLSIALGAIAGLLGTLWKGRPALRWLFERVRRRHVRRRQLLLLVEDVSALVLITHELVGVGADRADRHDELRDYVDERYDALDRQLTRVGHRLNAIEATFRKDRT